MRQKKKKKRTKDLIKQRPYPKSDVSYAMRTKHVLMSIQSIVFERYCKDIPKQGAKLINLTLSRRLITELEYLSGYKYLGLEFTCRDHLKNTYHGLHFIHSTKVTCKRLVMSRLSVPERR